MLGCWFYQLFLSPVLCLLSQQSDWNDWDLLKIFLIIFFFFLSHWPLVMVLPLKYVCHMWGIFQSLSSKRCAYVHACVCVCVSERGRENTPACVCAWQSFPSKCQSQWSFISSRLECRFNLIPTAVSEVHVSTSLVVTLLGIESPCRWKIKAGVHSFRHWLSAKAKRKGQLWPSDLLLQRVRNSTAKSPRQRMKSAASECDLIL